MELEKSGRIYKELLQKEVNTNKIYRGNIQTLEE